MEYEFEASELYVEGDIEMILPDHMTMLCADELARVKKSIDPEYRMIATGRHPITNEIVMIVATGQIFSTNKFSNDVGKVFPVNDGTAVVVGGRIVSFREALDGARVLYVNSRNQR